MAPTISHSPKQLTPRELVYPCHNILIRKEPCHGPGLSTVCSGPGFTQANHLAGPSASLRRLSGQEEPLRYAD